MLLSKRPLSQISMQIKSFDSPWTLLAAFFVYGSDFHGTHVRSSWPNSILEVIIGSLNISYSTGFL